MNQGLGEIMPLKILVYLDMLPLKIILSMN